MSPGCIYRLRHWMLGRGMVWKMTELGVAIMTACAWSFTLGFLIGPRRRAAKAPPPVFMLHAPDDGTTALGRKILADAAQVLESQRCIGDTHKYTKLGEISLPQGKVKVMMEVDDCS